MQRFLIYLVVVIAGLAAASEVCAQRALYGSQPGRDAVFVRFVNGLDAEVAVKSDLLPLQKLGTGLEERVGAYVMIDRPGARALTINVRSGNGETGAMIRFDPGSKVSILLRSDGYTVRAVALPARFEVNQTRTQLSFYNAAPACGAASLILEPANAVVFPNVPVDTERSRGINPINARFSTTCGEHGAANVKLERPEAGVAYSAWLLLIRGQPTLLLGADTLPSWNP